MVVERRENSTENLGVEAVGLGKICCMCCVNEQGEVQNDWK